METPKTHTNRKVNVRPRRINVVSTEECENTGIPYQRTTYVSPCQQRLINEQNEKLKQIRSSPSYTEKIEDLLKRLENLRPKVNNPPLNQEHPTFYLNSSIGSNLDDSLQILDDNEMDLDNIFSDLNGSNRQQNRLINSHRENSERNERTSLNNRQNSSRNRSNLDDSLQILDDMEMDGFLEDSERLNRSNRRNESPVLNNRRTRNRSNLDDSLQILDNTAMNLENLTGSINRTIGSNRQNLSNNSNRRVRQRQNRLVDISPYSNASNPDDSFQLLNNSRKEKNDLSKNRRKNSKRMEQASNLRKYEEKLFETMVRGIEQSEKIQQLKKKYYQGKGKEVPELSLSSLTRPLERIMEDNLLDPTQYHEVDSDTDKILDEPIQNRLKLPKPLIGYDGELEHESILEMEENPMEEYDRLLDEEELIDMYEIENDDMFADENIEQPSAAFPVLPVPEVLIDFLSSPLKNDKLNNKAFQDYCVILDKLKPKDRKHELPLFCKINRQKSTDLMEEEMPNILSSSHEMISPSNIANYIEDKFLLWEGDHRPFKAKPTILDDPVPMIQHQPIIKKVDTPKSRQRLNKVGNIPKMKNLSSHDIEYFVADENQNKLPKYFGASKLADLPSFIDVFVGESLEPFQYKLVDDNMLPTSVKPKIKRRHDFIWFGDEKPSTSEDEIVEELLPLEEEIIDEEEPIFEPEVFAEPEPSPIKKPPTPIKEIPWEIIAARLVHEKEKKLIAQGLLPDPKLIFNRTAPKSRLVPIPKRQIPSRTKISSTKGKEEEEEEIEAVVPASKSIKKVPPKSKLMPKRAGIKKDDAPKEFTREEKIQKIQEVLKSAEQNFANLYYQNELAKQKPPSRNIRKPVQPLPDIPSLRLPRWEPITENLDKVAWELVAVRKVKAMEKKLKEAGLLPDVKPAAKTPIVARSKIIKKPQIKKKIGKPVVAEQVLPPSKEERERLIAEVLQAADINFANKIYQSKLANEKSTAQNKSQSRIPPPWKKRK